MNYWEQLHELEYGGAASIANVVSVASEESGGPASLGCPPDPADQRSVQLHNSTDPSDCQAPTESGIESGTETPVLTLMEQLEQYAEQERLLARKQRAEQCGTTWAHYVDPTTGQLKTYQELCGLWRGQECPRCFKRRKDGFKARVTRALSNGPIAYLPLDDPQVEEVLPELTRDEYFKLPTDDGGAFFYDTTRRPKDRGKKVWSTNDFPEEQWDAWTDTPEGKRPSGGLGRSPDQQTENDRANDPRWAKIGCSEIVIAAVDRELAAELFDEASDATAQLRPTTPEAVSLAIAQRIIIWIDKLTEHGIRVLSSRAINRWVDLEHLNWSHIIELNPSGAPLEEDFGASSDRW